LIPGGPQSSKCIGFMWLKSFYPFHQHRLSSTIYHQLLNPFPIFCFSHILAPASVIYHKLYKTLRFSYHSFLWLKCSHPLYTMLYSKGSLDMRSFFHAFIFMYVCYHLRLINWYKKNLKLEHFCCCNSHCCQRRITSHSVLYFICDRLRRIIHFLNVQQKVIRFTLGYSSFCVIGQRWTVNVSLMSSPIWITNVHQQDQLL